MIFNCKKTFIIFNLAGLGFIFMLHTKYYPIVKISFILIEVMCFFVASLIICNNFQLHINGQKIELKRFVGKNITIEFNTIYKIGIENLPWRVTEKNMRMFIYTDDKIYEFSIRALDYKAIKKYCTFLCAHKGIKFEFKP